MRKPLLFLFVATVLSSCTMIPDTSRPDFIAAQDWSDVA